MERLPASSRAAAICSQSGVCGYISICGRNARAAQRSFRRPSTKPFLSPADASVPVARRAHAERWMILRASQHGSNPSRDPALTDYVEVKVDSVRVSPGSSVVFLRLQDEKKLCLSVWVGELESQALLKEVNKTRVVRPMTHDVAKNLLSIVGYRVTKIRITDIISDTYYARIHISRPHEDEVDVDARPSDAINLAVRFGAPMYVSKKIAALAMPHPGDIPTPTTESHTEIVRSVRELLNSFEDPLIMYTLQKDLAVHEQRFRDAQAVQKQITHEVMNNPLLSIIVAMESALNDSRFDEAARLRDQFRRLDAEQRRRAAANAQLSSDTTLAGESNLAGEHKMA